MHFPADNCRAPRGNFLNRNRVLDACLELILLEEPPLKSFFNSIDPQKDLSAIGSHALHEYVRAGQWKGAKAAVYHREGAT
jgi:hypothetical protein